MFECKGALIVFEKKWCGSAHRFVYKEKAYDFQYSLICGTSSMSKQKFHNDRKKSLESAFLGPIFNQYFRNIVISSSNIIIYSKFFQFKYFKLLNRCKNVVVLTMLAQHSALLYDVSSPWSWYWICEFDQINFHPNLVLQITRAEVSPQRSIQARKRSVGTARFPNYDQKQAQRIWTQQPAIKLKE